MQRNSLEQFILDNRAAFDTATPEYHVWTAIEQVLDAGQYQEELERFVRQNREGFDTAMPTGNLWAAIEHSLDATQKQDELKQFITVHREEFDTATPRRRVWMEIDKVLHPPQTQRKLSIAPIWRVMRVAAAVLILLSAGAMAGIYFTKHQKAQNQAVASLADISPEYAEMVRYYNDQINEKARQVSLESNDKSVFKDLDAIDRTMRELEAELPKAPKGAEEQIISNLIRSYQIKVEILEKVLNRIQQSKNSGTTKSEDDEITI